MTDLAELLRKHTEHRLADVRTAMPVRVKSYDLDERTVDVIPLVREITETDGEDIEEALPVIPSVPVAFPRAGGFFITFPIVPGDTGQIIVCDRSIDQWMARGSNSLTKIGDGPERSYSVKPLDQRRHHSSAAVFYPGLSDSQSPIADTHATNMVIGKDGGALISVRPDGSVAIVPSGAGKMHLGADTGTLAVARVTDLTIANTDMAAWITAVQLALSVIIPKHNAAAGVPVLAGGVGSVVPAVPPLDFGVINTGATKVTAT